MTGILSSTFGTFRPAAQTITVTEVNKTSTSTLNGGTNTTTSLTTANFTLTGGCHYIIMVACDPSGNQLPTITTNVGTELSTVFSGPATTSAGTGVLLKSFIFFNVITQITNIQAIFSAAITNKAMTIIELTGATTTQRNVATTSRGTTAAPNYASPSGNQFDMILTTLAQETNNANAPTVGATGTAGGTWSAISNNFTTGGGAATNVGISYQYKLLTATGSQTNTWTMGSTANWASQSFAIQVA